MAKSPQQVPPAAAFHESVVMKDILFVWGGRTDTLGQYHSHLHLFSVSLLNAEWRQHLVAPPELPAPCSGACSAAIGRTIFSYGGEISLLPFRTSNELYKLTIEDMRWKRVETRGSLPEGRHRAGMCSVNGKLLLMGGYGPLPSERRHPQAEYREGTTGEGWNNELFEFDPQTDCWSPVCVTGSKPSPREAHTLTALDEKRVILCGGFDGKKRCNDVWLFDIDRKVWSHITPHTSLWPEPRSSHTVCTMVCNDQEIKVLLIGGYGYKGVLSDCWLLDVMRGIGQKVTFGGEPLSRAGHSSGCVALLDGTVVISVTGGCTTHRASSVVSNPCFYHWSAHHPTVLHSGLPPAAVLRPHSHLSAAPPAPAVGTSEQIRQLKEEVNNLTVITELQHGQLDQMNTELVQERSRRDGLKEEKEQVESTVHLELEKLRKQIRQLTVTNEQLTREVEKRDKQIWQLSEDKQYLANRLSTETTINETLVYHKKRAVGTLHSETHEKQRETDQMREDRARLEQRIEELEQLLSNAEAAGEEAEKRLRDNEQLLNIPEQDIQLSDKELGSGSFGGVHIGYWRGCPVAVKTLHAELAKEHYQRRLFEQEVSVCSRLHHPNIAAVCGFIKQNDAPLSLVMELLQASMADIIEAAHVSGRYLTVREQTDVSHDCLSGLTYLHDLPCAVLHGDIRPTNILITSMMRAKIGDLGAARFSDGSLSVGPMSPLYVAPERLADRTLPNSKEADVYSMGVSLGECFTGNQMDRKDRLLQLRSVRQRDLRLLCISMSCENGGQRMMAREALRVNDRVLKCDEYSRCDPRRMVKGVVDGVKKVSLCEKPW